MPTPDGTTRRQTGDRLTADANAIDANAVGDDDDVFGDGAPLVLIGLDGEMSSADIADGGKLIQAGAAAWSGEPGGGIEVFTSLIGHTEMAWSDRAAAVHGISRDALADAPRPDEVDDALAAWLLERGAVDGQRVVVPVGLNVAAFDLPFFRQSLPTATALLSRRAVDLNAMLFTFAGWDPNPRAAARGFYGWKRSFKKAANAELAKLGMATREHDAGYDAAQALAGWWWLRSQFADLGVRLDAANERLDAADPLRAVLGDGLLTRLAGVDRVELAALVAALGPDVTPRRWFGTRTPSLGGRSPLEALVAGDLDAVRALAAATP